MLNQRIYVNVVGFTDVERHALNTVFRLSEERELSYGLWLPMTASELQPSAMHAEVALVDGESAEAILAHAKELPRGQRLIWVGEGAPAHAWRVLRRPIQWSNVLTDLDAIYAARQVESGFLDLDITAPAPLEIEAGVVHKRALLVGPSPLEQRALRAGLAVVGLTEVDLAQTTEAALERMGRQTYGCGVFDLDSHHIDVWSLARLFAQRNPYALTMGISEHAGRLSPWWNRRRMKRDTERTGINALVPRPLLLGELRPWFELLR